jgi:hypothetical protein
MAEYPQGVLEARVIQAQEMAASVLQSELDSITMKETDDPQSMDNKFNELARLYTTLSITLTAALNSNQLTKTCHHCTRSALTWQKTAQSEATEYASNNFNCSNEVKWRDNSSPSKNQFGVN